MLNQGTVFAVVAVRDMSAARDFYTNVLGLQVTDDDPGGITLSSGSGKLFVYESANGGQNPATSAGWHVDSVESAVEELKTRGVMFEHYEGMPGEWQGDIMVMDGRKAAWFKDPSGNILALDGE
jgi:catechol 2,3-dioxygenase-like lactoylglutathione lyase family enzyme